MAERKKSLIIAALSYIRHIGLLTSSSLLGFVPHQLIKGVAVVAMNSTAIRRWRDCTVGLAYDESCVAEKYPLLYAQESRKTWIPARVEG